ncbi:MAG: hypothetical protein IT370_25810 [Deltaproteobacteria bacterium]|nr:hypothetical protein [Deltaproteobacteria bacterium]
MKRLLGLIVVIVAATPSCKKAARKQPGEPPSPLATPASAADAAPAPSALTVVGKQDGARQALFCGDRVLLVGDQGKLRLWQPASSQVVERTLDGEVVACGALGHVLTLRRDQGELELHRLLDGEEGCAGATQAVALSPDGRQFAVAGAKIQLLWLEAGPDHLASPANPKGPCEAMRTPGHPKPRWTSFQTPPGNLAVSEVFFDPEVTTLGVRGAGMGALWQLSAPGQPLLFKARQDGPVATRRGRLAVITETGTVNVSGGAGAPVDLATTGKVTALMLTTEADFVVVGLEDGSVTRYLLDNKAATALGNLGEPVLTLALAGDGRVAAAGATRAAFWSADGKELARVQGEQVALATDARSVVTVTGGTAQVSTVAATASR